MHQDFSRKNLRGRSFRGQDLTGANFSDADIRGTNFTGAVLVDANFSHAKAGLQKRWVTILFIISLLLSGIAGYLSALIGVLVVIIFSNSNQSSQIANLAVLLGLIILFTLIIRRGLNSALTLALASGIVGTIAGTIARTIAGTTTITIIFAIAGTFIGGIAFAIAFAIARTFVGCIAFAICFAIAGTVAAAFGFAGAMDIAIDITGSVAIVTTIAEVIPGAIAITIFMLNGYIAWRALQGDEKYTLIKNIAIAVMTFGGTSFKNANLTGANFTNATFKSTDFRKANLTRACFHKAQKLNQVRPGSSYITKTQVLKVLVTGQGQNLNFDRQDLRGVNFQGANLSDASFIGADLSGANLQDADLSRVKLVQTQLDETDFTGATLTGACIEDWNITSSTNFNGVRCKYIYMRLPDKNNPDPHRKPDNREEVFGDGEFGDFIKPIFDTLDLYHSQGVDPRAIAISFKQLAENHPEAELRIVGMEVKGDNKFLLRAETASGADKSELSAEYFSMYNELKALALQEIKALVAEKDIQISRLENMVMTALEHPSFYAQTYNNLRGAQFGGAFIDANTLNTQHIGGNITNCATEQNQNLVQAATEIQQLLVRLEKTNHTTTSAQKMAVLTKAVDEIEKNPTLKARVVEVLNASGAEALKEALNHPLANIFILSFTLNKKS